MSKEFRYNISYAQVDLKAIKYNLRQIKKWAKRTELMPVIKADAYGHDMVRVAKLLLKEGIKSFAVSDVVEGIALRNAGIRRDILLLENTLSVHAKDVIKNKLIPTVCTWELAKAIDKRARKPYPVHIKIDTGMGRFGIWQKDALDFILKVNGLARIKIEGVYTHFPVADTSCRFTQQQAKVMERLKKDLEKHNISVPYYHAANSMGLMAYNHKIFNLARPGLILYGLYPDKKLKKKITLKPVLEVHSKVIYLKTIEKNRSLSYGRQFIAKKKMKVATIPVGYKDGYLRLLSNKAAVLIAGHRCPVLGRVTMDQIIVDVSSVKNVKLGSPVVILGKQGNQQISADELAEFSQTINYEIVTGLGNNLPRKILK